ncbi:2-succinyl-5-enolpyruvyl-6-hydroxy-3-cyclohexene-1-carboxylic-acid synthase [Croceimicrobium hydrocarbonivorans]|uniref:2-succinyl-5-enolpyruvyl-6-hydroxy-3-cyclohexene-1-carboxylate synthase n=1 Tax=Croceimicrobium hydrocarbonivorans TaxID=2761580 RepID=A0A7H0VDG2_9FLAO|nr:2-succinyl-5-enolpyruvyl-6-hydroxy-3-cyclohexene-1-carboxylic-acid synthase [Croceimicrobium hydrocarbonivorans]QNR23760.1 2-succinyl-5-enolpyruvyl-6-hydroxy-3-cyclohexene-1-carboxylic-acid synthase [Croceimicrobium hydrocarbonivorans]
MSKTSSLYNARLLAHVLKAHECENLVVAPGSRNAPLIYACMAEGFETYSIPDERAAAFTALGMALEKGKPAAVICTSGSAAANFLPAVTEAYYQKVPLVVITADRPQEWIGQGAGQTIMQEGIYGKHILGEANLIREPQDDLARQYNLRISQEALLNLHKGPVHINVPFDEPLYDEYEGPEEQFRIIRRPATERHLNEADLSELVQSFEQAERPMILVGQMSPDPALEQALALLLKKRPFLLLSETLSNLNHIPGVHSIDRMVNTLGEEEAALLQPDLLISLGGEIVSKMVKAYLRKSGDFPHWHFTEDEIFKDTFHKLTLNLDCKASWFFQQLSERVQAKANPWVQKVWELEESRAQWHKDYLKNCEYSDLKVYAELLKHLPQSTVLHSANSAGIRYAQLFDHRDDVRHYANRGTSGIDGSTSTAIGHALNTEDPVVLVSGDVAFQYDNAAFWNDRLPQNLKVIVINNQGGNIFRIIKGPDKIEDFERFQETQHQLNLSAVAKMYGIAYQEIAREEDLSTGIEAFFALEGLAILEIKTPRLESPDVLKNYFQFLKSH